MTPNSPASDQGAATWLRRAFFFAVLAFVWWRFSENTADNDLWGHVLYGQRMLHLHGLELTEMLSWTAAGLPWINHEVLAEIMMGLVHRLGGSSGLWSMMMILAALTLGLAWHAGAGTDRTRRLVALALLALATNFIALGYSVRPQLFTYLFFVILLVALQRFFAGRFAWGLVLPALFVVWVNTHGGFLAGWVIVLLAAGAELAAPLFPALQRCLRCPPVAVSRTALASLAAGSTLALLANPWGGKLVVWTFATLQLPRPHILEWQPLPFTVATLPFHCVVLLGAAAWIVSRQPRRIWEMAGWTLLAALAIRTQRHAPLFGLASLIFLPVHLQDAFARLSPRLANLHRALQQPAVAPGMALALVAAGGWCFKASASAPRMHPFRMEVPRALFPVAAIEHMRAHHLTGNTVTFFDWGQQVLWELPDNPVSFDGRLDTVYPVDLMDAHWRLYAGTDPGPALALDKAQFALLPTGGGGIRWLRAHGWMIVYEDPLATVLIHRFAAVMPAWGDDSATAGSVPFPDAPPLLATRVTALVKP